MNNILLLIKIISKTSERYIKNEFGIEVKKDCSKITIIGFKNCGVPE
jgi:hypothetical protein